MHIPHEPFEEWHAQHLQGLMTGYREYLREVLADDGFDITHVEDYWTWASEEYALLQEYADEGDAAARRE